MGPSVLRTGSAPIPFRHVFAHASATRAAAANVLAYVEDGNGAFGVGEGCPRPYVTGETVASALAFLDRHRPSFLRIADTDALRRWIAEHEREIDANPSAFCAVELALLDLFARRTGDSIERHLGIATPQIAPRASAVHGTGGTATFGLRAAFFLLFGMREAKLKLSGASNRDLWRARLLAAFGRLRLDANNLWRGTEDALPPLSALAAHAWAVEEPIGVRDWSGMAEIARATGLKIIADESFTRAADLEVMPEGEQFIPNFRISKLGGLLRSLAALATAQAQGRSIVLGAQVGETSILARAGLAVAAAAGQRMIAYEGAYGARLLAWDIVSPSIGFRRGGAVAGHLAPASATGLGLMPSAAFFAAMQADR